MVENTLGEQYKRRRKELKITQSQLAELTNISVNTLVQLERGKGNPTLDIMTKVADALGLELTLQVRKLTITP